MELEDEGEAHVPNILPPAIGRGQARRPYFEMLLVAPGERSAWPTLRDTFRRLRQEHDEFIYEPVVVGSFEDALLAILFNYDLQAVVIADGFAFRSQHSVPVLREILERHIRLNGIKERYTTPYFDNLKRYARRPIGTFHALPVARGKSIFK